MRLGAQSNPGLMEANMTMTDLTVRTLEASTKMISLDTVAGLRNKLRGTSGLAW